MNENPIKRSAGRWQLFLGLALVVLGPAIYMVQFAVKQLVVPWYIPILTTLGLLLILRALWIRPTITRGVVAVLLLLFCGFEWFAFGVATRLPSYEGPAQAGQSIPAFATTRADGTPFTDTDLRQGSNSVLVFFRGRW